MKPSVTRTRAALTELFNSLKITSSSAAAASTSSAQQESRPVAKWNALAREPPSDIPLTKEEVSLTRLLNTFLKTELEQNSVMSPVTDHFLDLFTGLNIIDATGKPPSGAARSGAPRIIELSDKQLAEFLNTCKSDVALTQALDELYYHSRLTRPLASVILRNPAFTTGVPHMHHLALARHAPVGWTVSGLFTFKLQLANKYWVLGCKDRAQSLIMPEFEALWLPAVRDQTVLAYGTVWALAKALFLFGRADLVRKLFPITAESTNSTSSSSSEPAKLKLATGLPFWVEAHKHSDLELCAQITRNLISERGAHGQEFVYAVMQILNGYSASAAAEAVKELGRSSHVVGGALLLRLAELVCVTRDQKLYDVVKSYLDTVLGSTGVTATAHASKDKLSTALAYQKLQSFNTKPSSKLTGEESSLDTESAVPATHY
ncbi:hypothetical protein DV451_000360 [Geotrichum candidum]|uniref:Uncharacterized protein n=1 Tax=Geotrichum candidum TaxID=1173061 RepID=A0A9P5KVM2_GEOCN|nr:hypothetical protein DV451_000360 [Geotrichum candidum]